MIQTVLIKYVNMDFDVRKQHKIDFFTERSIIMDYGLIFWPEVTV